MKQQKRKKGLFFLSFLFLIAALFLFRAPLLRFALSFVLPSSITYEKLEWKSGRVLAQGVRLEDEGVRADVDQLEFTFHPNLSALHLETRVTVSHPQILLKDDECANSALPLHLLIPTRFLSVKLQVKNGVLTLADANRFYFAFDPGNIREEIGRFSLSSDPALFHFPLLRIDLKMEEGGLAASLKTDEISSTHLFQLASAFYPPLIGGWKSLDGRVELKADLLLSRELSLSSLSAEFAARAFSLANPELGIEIEGQALQGNFSLPPLEEVQKDVWKQLSVSLTLEGADCSYLVPGQDEPERIKVLSHMDAAFVLEPEKEPVFQVRSRLYSGERELALRLEGSGKVEKSGSFWTALDMSLGEESTLPAKARLALSSPGSGEYLLQTQFEEVGPELLSLLQPWLPFIVKEGLLDGKLTAEVKKGALALCNFEEMSLRKFSFEMLNPQEMWQGKIDLLELSGEARKESVGWNFSQLMIQGFQGEFQSGKVLIQGDEFELAMDPFGISRIAYKGALQGLIADLEVHRNETEDASLPSEAQAGPKVEEYALVGTATLQELSTVEFGCKFKAGTFSSADELLGLLKPQEGWLRTSTLTSAVYRDLVHTIDPDLHLEGSATLSATFDDKGASCTAVIEEFAARRADLTLQHAEPFEAHLTYNYESNEIEAEFPFRAGRLIEKKSALQIENLAAHFTILKDHASILRFTGEVKSGQLPLSSSLKLKEISCTLASDSDSKLLSLTCGKGLLTTKEGSSYQMELPQLVFKFTDDPQAEFDLTLSEDKQRILRLAGKVDYLKTGLSLNLDPARCHFFQTKVRNLSLSLNAKGSLHLMSCDLAVSGKELPLQCAFLKKCEFINFDLPEITSNEAIDLRLTYMGFLGFEAEGKQLNYKGKSYPHFSLKGEKRGSEWTIKKLNVAGLILQTNFLVEPKRVFIKEFNLSNASVRMHGAGIYEMATNRLACDIDTYLVDLAKNSSDSAISTIKGRGKVEVDLEKLQVEGEVAAEVQLSDERLQTFKMEKPAAFSYSTKKGLEVKKIDLFSQREESHLAIDKIALDPQLKSGSAKKASYSTIKPLFGSNMWEMRDLNFVRGETIWQIAGFSKLQEKSLFLQCAVDSAQEKQICIQIKEDPKAAGLKFLGYSQGKKGLIWQSIRGKFSGLEMDIVSGGGEKKLSGSIKVDLAQLSALLPKQMQEVIALLKLGKGYQLTGDFNLGKESGQVGSGVQFRGALSGQDFECLGYTLGSFNTRAEVSLDRLIFTQLNVSDPAAEIRIKTVRIEKRPSTGEWHLEVPIVQAQELRPSLLRRGKEAAGKPKPLVVKHFTLTDIRGELGDASSFRGRGELDFTNAFKKESSLLDMPIQFIKDLGLDPGVLVPVYGELELEMKAGRFYIKELKSAHSEGMRSEFYLAEETPSFIDFKGNVHVDIKMKQNVAFKLVEPFTLKVRGTLEKPRYGL